MKKLLVFNKYQDVLNHVKKHGTNNDVSLISLKEGIYRVQQTKDEKFDLVVYVGDKTESLYELVEDLHKFYNDLRRFEMVHKKTIYC